MQPSSAWSRTSETDIFQSDPFPAQLVRLPYRQVQYYICKVALSTTLNAMANQNELFGFLLATAARLFRDRCERALREESFEITPGEARALAIADRLGSPRQAELATALGIAPMSLVNLLDKLEHRGLIERNPDSVDGRSKRIVITASARPELAKMRVIFETARKSAMRDFTATEVACFQSLLLRLSESLMAEEGRSSDRHP